MAGPSSRPDKSNLLMGRIGAAHGIRGEVRIQSFTADPLDIAGYGPLSTQKPDLTIRIKKARLAKNVIVASLEGINDRNAAEALNGTELYVARAKLPPETGEDDFYLTDLIGLEARLTDGTVVGTIIDVPDFGAGSLLEVAPISANSAQTPKSLLFSFTRNIVPEIHIIRGYILLVPPEEIEVQDTDESGSE